MKLDKQDSTFDLDDDRIEVYSKYVLFYNHAYKGNKVQAVSSLVSIRLGLDTQIKNIDKRLSKTYKITDSLKQLAEGHFSIGLKDVQQGNGKFLIAEIREKAKNLLSFIDDLKFSYGYGITNDEQLHSQLRHIQDEVSYIMTKAVDNSIRDNWRDFLKSNLQLYKQRYLSQYHINCITTIIGQVLLKNYPIQVGSYSQLNINERINLLSNNINDYDGELSQECIQELIKYRDIYPELEMDDFFNKVWSHSTICQTAQITSQSGEVDFIEISWRKLRNLSLVQCPHEFSAFLSES